MGPYYDYVVLLSLGLPHRPFELEERERAAEQVQPGFPLRFGRLAIRRLAPLVRRYSRLGRAQEYLGVPAEGDGVVPSAR